jgi:hypothetical protein
MIFSDPDPTFQIILVPDSDPVSEPALIFSNIFDINVTFVITTRYKLL